MLNLEFLQQNPVELHEFHRILAAFEQDEKLSEVLVNGISRMQIFLGNKRETRHSPFQDAHGFEIFLQRFVHSQGKRLDPLHPSSGGELMELGIPFRWHAVLRVVAPEGPLLSLRRHRFLEVSLSSFHRGSWALPRLKGAMDEGRPLLICGPTGSGKTSFLSAVLREFCQRERVAILEEVSEIHAIAPDWIRLKARSAGYSDQKEITLSDLFYECLRLRPDRIVLGEVRTPKEGEVLKQALVMGHNGCMATLHVDHPSLLAHRLRGASGPEAMGLLYERNPLVIELERGTPPKIASLSGLQDWAGGEGH